MNVLHSAISPSLSILLALFASGCVAAEAGSGAPPDPVDDPVVTDPDPDVRTGMDPLVGGSSDFVWFPEVGQIVSTNADGGKTHVCAGTLIGRSTILTAAHCFDAIPRTGVEGVVPAAGAGSLSFVVTKWADRDTNLISRILTFRVNDGYAFPRHDLAVARLETPVTDVVPGNVCGQPNRGCASSRIAFEEMPPIRGVRGDEAVVVAWGRGVANDAATAGIKRKANAMVTEVIDGEIFLDAGVCNGDAGGAVLGRRAHSWEQSYPIAGSSDWELVTLTNEWLIQEAMIVRMTNGCTGGAAILLRPYEAWIRSVAGRDFGRFGAATPSEDADSPA